MSRTAKTYIKNIRDIPHFVGEVETKVKHRRHINQAKSKHTSFWSRKSKNRSNLVNKSIKHSSNKPDFSPERRNRGGAQSNHISRTVKTSPISSVKNFEIYVEYSSNVGRAL